MIIRLSIENFLSFGGRTTFSMIPGKARMHEDHKISFKDRKEIDLLKLSIIYGKNASGKSNLVKALSFLRDFVLNGVKPHQEINIKNYKLNKDFEKAPSRFEIEFRRLNKNYAFGFVADRKRIYEEWLYEINKTSEKLIYERKMNQNGISEFSFSKIFFKLKEEKAFLNFLGKGTRDNQLFLTEGLQRNIKNNIENIDGILNTLDWFGENLIVIFPESKFGGLLFELEKNEDFGKSLTDYLKRFDTDIDGVELIEFDIDKIPNLSKQFKEKVLNDITTKSKLLLSDLDNNMFSISKDKNGNVLTNRVMTKHQVINSKSCAYFELGEESDGTLRLIDLIPSLMELTRYEKVFIIDEIDRSLHPNLSKKFLELFLEKSKNIQSQLIVTTHEASFLNLKHFRKDEFWFVEKDKKNETKLFSLDEFNIRFDKRIRTDYLLGRYGAVPSIKSF